MCPLLMMVVSADGAKSIHLQQVNGFLKYNTFLQKPTPSIVTHTNKMCTVLHSKHAHIANKINKFTLHKFPLTTIPNKPTTTRTKFSHGWFPTCKQSHAIIRGSSQHANNYYMKTNTRIAPNTLTTTNKRKGSSQNANSYKHTQG